MKLRIGQKVKYLRVDAQGMEISGEGVIHNLFLDADRRIQAGVRDGDHRFNIDIPAINTTPDQEKAYFAHIAAIRQRADAINAEVKAFVDKGNAEIEAMNAAYLGAPLDLPT